MSPRDLEALRARLGLREGQRVGLGRMGDDERRGGPIRLGFHYPILRSEGPGVCMSITLGGRTVTETPDQDEAEGALLAILEGVLNGDVRLVKARKADSRGA